MRREDDREYRRLRDAIGGAALPCALVDLDAFERNVDVLVEPLRAAGKGLRIATKSLRCLELVRRVAARAGTCVRGVMAFSVREGAWLADQGVGDVLVAYPTASALDAAAIAQAVAKGGSISVVADAGEHVELLESAARDVGSRIRVVVDIDVSLRALGGALHVGVRRSPLHDPEAVVQLCTRIAGSQHLTFEGLLGYEAHIAGLGDQNPFARHLDGAKRMLKRIARPAVERSRRRVIEALARRGLTPGLFNGGGTGSVRSSASDPTLTEVTVGSGFVDSHLFDQFRGLVLEPSAFFALQVTRVPAPGFVTCQSGGFVASGGAGPDRLPIPVLPRGLALLGMEGAGEVQTPLAVAPGVSLSIGAPVFFRHAKAGELAEHFTEYLLVRGDRVEARAPTYRGAGLCFH